jgi:hypothetical protein
MHAVANCISGIASSSVAATTAGAWFAADLRRDAAEVKGALPPGPAAVRLMSFSHASCDIAANNPPLFCMVFNNGASLTIFIPLFNTNLLTPCRGVPEFVC